MKKNLLLIVFALASSVAFAQNTSKNGHQITPEPGDYGLGIDVDPFFSYIGNMFNGTSDNSSPSWNYTTNEPIPFVITGLMIKDETTAYRGKIRIGTGSRTTTNVIDQDGGSDPNATTEDELKTSATNILLSGGLQKTRGKHRVKGIYGAEILIGTGNGGKSEFDYGNPILIDSTSANHGQATITDWPSSSTIVVSSRTTETKIGSTFYLGLRGFVGIEYFIGPKVSIAGEFGWGLGLASTGEGEQTTESFNSGDPTIFSDDTITSTTSKTGKASSFGLDNDSGNPFSPGSGSLRLTFYF